MTSDWVRLYRRDTDEMVWHLAWDEITQIAAWKDDVWSYDIICCGFQWSGADGWKWVDEQMEGWDELHQAIEARFGVRQYDWWKYVAFPAFASNFTVLWPGDGLR